MNFTRIVTWCNVNQGFATIILSIFTLVVSIIAIVVSIRTANLPFKKMLNINCVFDELTDRYQCKIYIMNTGNKILGIFNVSLENDKYFLCNTNNRIKYIEPSKVVEYTLKFDKNKIEEVDEEIIIKILDTEQETHIFKVAFAMG